MSQQAGSRYANDPRVVWPKKDWPPDVVALIPDQVDENYSRIIVRAEGGGFVVKGAVSPDGSLRDPGDRYNQRLQVFDTVDAAFMHVFGEPE